MPFTQQQYQQQPAQGGFDQQLQGAGFPGGGYSTAVQPGGQSAHLAPQQALPPVLPGQAMPPQQQQQMAPPQYGPPQLPAGQIPGQPPSHNPYNTQQPITLDQIPHQTAHGGPLPPEAPMQQQLLDQANAGFPQQQAQQQQAQQQQAQQQAPQQQAQQQQQASQTSIPGYDTTAGMIPGYGQEPARPPVVTEKVTGVEVVDSVEGLSEEDKGTWGGFVTSAKLTKDQQKALGDTLGKTVENFESYQKLLDQQNVDRQYAEQNKWRENLFKSPEFGKNDPNEFHAAVGKTAAFVNAFGPEMRKAMDESGKSLPDHVMLMVYRAQQYLERGPSGNQPLYPNGQPTQAPQGPDGWYATPS